nr:MAG TPA: hypothetical protein [Caudoviricetes sp.]
MPSKSMVGYLSIQKESTLTRDSLYRPSPTAISSYRLIKA